jgi:hypothetical protein
LQAVSKLVGKDLKRMCRKYDTKIASFQNSPTFSLEEEFNFCSFNVIFSSTKSEGNRSEGNGFNLTVGKNNISIPTLHLPDRYNNANSEDRNMHHIPPELSPDNLSPDSSPEMSPT